MQAYSDLGRLSLGTIRCIREVLNYRSVTLAAERLGITQSAASQQIARFEKLSGIPIMTRIGGRMAVRSDKVAQLISTMIETADELSCVARDGGKTRLRLGICGYLATRYCLDMKRYRKLADEFDIHIGGPSELIEIYSRGELDIVVRPLFHHEPEVDLMTDLPMVWVAFDESRSGDLAQEDKPVPVILETHLSPYSYYVERPLKESRTPHHIVARVDNYLVRSRFVAEGLGCTSIPKFLTPSLPPAIKTVTNLPKVDNIRLGVIYNKKATSFKKAEGVLDASMEMLCD
ncbi:LysR family transcriptional regulator [Ciceribacter sp. RN22]|uniref:LysR family transcriptional regulator n=1 Tax=Ciceribacter sp. RN22 TaxID=2954932 RepID=UPI002092CBAC|nr:LysR family transcriptional regulator [Ciceribacter sp. RN22]MCO6180754.1 LysR family transcriptional regulator [Ciceribacter sp. RN22]